jgi:hypothetical protein
MQQLYCLAVIYFPFRVCLKQCHGAILLLSLQDMEVNFFQAYIDGVDFVFIESPMFRNLQHNIYGGNRMVCYHLL